MSSTEDDEGLTSNFKHSIASGGGCGFNNMGKVQTLVNGDKKNAYNVTVRESWTQPGYGSGSSDRVVYSAAGQRQRIGCSVSVERPLVDYKYKVVGESLA